MSSKKQFLTYLKPRLSEKRFQHSVGVMQTMDKLADIYNLDKEQATTAGILHDIAKELESDQYKKIIKDAKIEIRCKEDKNFHFYLHGPVGAYLAEKELQIKDPVILNAIETHTFYGVFDEQFNTRLNWCLHFSDILEPNRDWHQVKWLHDHGDELANTIYSGQLHKSIVFFTGGIIEWFENDNLPVHPNIYRAYAEYAKTLAKQ